MGVDEEELIGERLGRLGLVLYQKYMAMYEIYLPRCL